MLKKDLKVSTEYMNYKKQDLEMNFAPAKHMHCDNIPHFREVIHCVYKIGFNVRSFEFAYFCMLF